jgi:hypothetical protein
MSDEETQEQPLLPVALEARWKAIKQSAEGIGCAVRISLVVGGVDIATLYQIRDLREQATTLGESLTQVEALIADPRTDQVAKALLRLRLAESLAEQAASLQREREEQYGVALRAFHQAHVDDLGESAEAVGQVLISFAADDRIADELTAKPTTQADEETTDDPDVDES